MNPEKLHNDLVNADRVESCTFTDAAYKGDLNPNEVFVIGLAVTQGTSYGLREWVLEDTEVTEVKHYERVNNVANKIHVSTNRATYIFEYDSDDYSLNIGCIAECKITAKEFELDTDRIPESVLEAVDDKVAVLREENSKR